MNIQSANKILLQSLPGALTQLRENAGIGHNFINIPGLSLLKYNC